MPKDEPKTPVSHADLDAALESDAAARAAAEPAKVVKEPEPPEPAKAIASDPDPLLEPDPSLEPEPLPDPDSDPDLSLESDPTLDPDPDALPPEPDDHKERSKMGRRMSELEGNINRLVGVVEKLATTKAEPDLDPDDDEPVFMTKKQLREFVRSQAKDEVRQTKADETKAQKDYENAYVAQVRKVGSDLPPKQLEAVFKEMFDNHNNVVHKIPEVDADINFHRAVASLAARTTPAKKVIPLKKDDPKNLGGPADTKIEGKKVAPVKLDEHAAAFAKYHNLSDEKVTAALSGETKPSLRGKFG